MRLLDMEKRRSQMGVDHIAEQDGYQINNMHRFERDRKQVSMGNGDLEHLCTSRPKLTRLHRVAIGQDIPLLTVIVAIALGLVGIRGYIIYLPAWR